MALLPADLLKLFTTTYSLTEEKLYPRRWTDHVQSSYLLYITRSFPVRSNGATCAELEKIS